MTALLTRLYFLLTLTTVICGIPYDAKNCGLQDARFRRPRSNVSAINGNNGGAAKYAKYGTIDDDYYGTSYDDYAPDYDIGNSASDEREEIDPMEHLMTGGRFVLRGELPWTVFVLITTGGKSLSWCTGTLVSRRHILTAGHCFRNEGQCSMLSPDAVVKHSRAMVGGFCLEKDNKTRCTHKDVGFSMNFKKVDYYDFFKEGCKKTNDIAFIELEKDIPKSANHICLPHLHNVDELDVNFAKHFVAGWGADPAVGSSRPARLQRMDLGPRMPHSLCQLVREKGLDMFCTLGTPRKSPCGGDSGAGVVTVHKGKHYLLGTVSYGTQCDALLRGDDFGPAVFTDTAYYTAKIDSFLNMKAKDHREEFEDTKIQLEHLNHLDFLARKSSTVERIIRNNGSFIVFLLLYYYLY